MYNISIIIPHYNCPQLLERLLCTIPERENIQVIVVDDNSTEEIDKFNEVVRKFAHCVEFYTNESGIQSAGVCRNIGLSHVKSEWVLFADSDDIFLPQMYSCISQYFYSEYEMVIFTPTSIFNDTGEVADRHIMNEKRINKYLLNPTQQNMLNVKKMKEPWSKMIRSSIIEKYAIRFSETLHANDMYFSCVSSFYCSKVLICKDRIYCITRNRGSLTTRNTSIAFDLSVQEVIKCYAFAKEHYSIKDLKELNMNGGILLFQAWKRKLGWKKILQTLVLLKRNNVPLLSKQMSNPVNMLKEVLVNNAIVEREKKYYIQK